MNVTITIDGKTLQVEQGANLLEAALQNGIYIPHLCHHPDLPDLGSCRLCIVEVLLQNFHDNAPSHGLNPPLPPPFSVLPM